MPQAKSKKKSPEKKPTSARLLKHRPVDPEPPTENEVEDELLKTPENKAKRGPKQKRLPTMEDPAIEELEEKAEEYADIRDQRMELTPIESKLNGELLELMKKHGKTSYHHDGYDIKIVVESEKVKVKVSKDKDE